MNWPRDNTGISEKDFKAVFSYEPKDTTVLHLSGENGELRRDTLATDEDWDQWLESNLPLRPDQNLSGVVLILARRPGRQMAPFRSTSIPLVGYGPKGKTKTIKDWRSSTLPQGAPHPVTPDGAISASGERAVRTLPFSINTFRRIADRFCIHGSISKVVNRADVPVFTQATVLMGTSSGTSYPALVYNCRSTNVWDLDLALSVTYFPHCRLTYGILYGCPAPIEREIIDRLSLASKWEARHPLLLPGIFTELERGRHLKVVERNIDALEGEMFQLDFQPSLKEKIRHKDAYTRNAQKKTAWLDTTYLRNGLTSWRTQLSNMAEYCDELDTILFTDGVLKKSGHHRYEKPRAESVDIDDLRNELSGLPGHEDDGLVDAEISGMRAVSRLVKERILAIVDEYEDKIRETTMRIDGMAMATQWSHGETNVEIALATIRDSRYMKSIALVTMVFLPGTFLASIFSMTFFNWSTDGSSGSTVSQYIWVYFVLAAACTAVTLALWYYMVIYRERRRATRPGDVEMGALDVR